MAIPDGLKAVNEVITASNWDMNRLIQKAAEIANQELGPAPGYPPGTFFGLHACRTDYGLSNRGLNNEMISWYLSIILAEYTAGILGEKVREGHCNAHRLAPTYQPCPDMQAEHMKMLEVFRGRVKQLLADVEGAVSQARQHLTVPKPVPPQSTGS
jgi:hypothetical protein